MCPQSMVTSGDSKTGKVVVEDGKGESLPVEGCPQGSNQTHDRNADNEGNIEPIDMLVPIGPRHFGVCDVWFFWVIFVASVGF